MTNHALETAARALRNARCAIAFTGAGISVESGIPPFRGPGGIWSKYDPDLFEKGYFKRYPEKVWPMLKEIFYSGMERTKPNPAHLALAELEAAGLLAAVITQNVDGLHQLAGSSNVLEYHGSIHRMQCMDCRAFFDSAAIALTTLPPPCPACGGLLKPDIVFFSEGVPSDVHHEATRLAQQSDCCLIVGTGGQVVPAGRIPQITKQAGGTIIEINREGSHYSYNTTDHFLQGKAGTMLPRLVDAVLER